MNPGDSVDVVVVVVVNVVVVVAGFRTRLFVIVEHTRARRLNAPSLRFRLR